MSFICVVCREKLVRRTGRQFGMPPNSSFAWADSEDSDDEENCADTALVTTTCGHLFHQSCLTKWFKVELESGAPWKSCPYCKKVLNALPINCDPIEHQGFHRVYPVCAEVYEDQESFTNKDRDQPEKSAETLSETESVLGNLKAVNLIQKKTNKLLEDELSEMRENMQTKSDAFDELETQVTGITDILQSLEIENKALQILRYKLMKHMENKVQGKGNQVSSHHHRLQQKANQAGFLNSIYNKDDTTALPAAILGTNACGTGPSLPPPPVLPPKLLSNRTRPSSHNNKSGELRLGDRVLYRSSSLFASSPLPYSGIVKSLYLNRFGRKMAGVEFEQKIPHGMSGLFFIRQYFDCRPKHGRLIEPRRLTKIQP